MDNSRVQFINHKSLPFYLRRSTYIHVILILSTMISGKIIYEIAAKKRAENLELIQASVRVDMVAMPTHTLNELKNLSSGVEEAQKEEVSSVAEKKAAEEIIKEEVVKEEIKEEFKEEVKAETKSKAPSFEEVQTQKRQDFLSKLKKIGNKKVDSTGNQKAEKGLYGERDSDLKRLVLSGNKLSRGTQMYGDGGGAEMTAFQAYASRLPDLVRPHWRLPSFLLEKKLKCRIRVWIAMNGELTRAEVYQSSGDGEYDQKALEAVHSASPFPALTDEFGKRAQKGDILLGFPL